MRNNFDREFNSTRRMIIWGWLFAIVFKVAIVCGLFWLALYAIDAFAA